jgi:predicted metal-dependent hydrolase
MFDPQYAYIECSFCNGKFQVLKEYDYGLDTDHDVLSARMAEHWAKCTAEEPYADPQGDYE